MSSPVSAVSLVSGTAPVVRRVRAYFAPVNRAAGVPSIWDPAGIAAFDVNQPPAPWIDLGWCAGFTRKSGTKVQGLLTGAPATIAAQARTQVEASVAMVFESWGKLPLALTAGTQQMNVLRTGAGSVANGSGGTVALTAVPLTAGTAAKTLSNATTATALDVGAAAASFSVGDVVAVDGDYTGQLGYVGAGVSGGFVKSVAAIGADVDYVRRVTLNVGRVTGITGGVLTLGSALLAGAPVFGMQVSRVVAFCDREGGSFFPEWSGLFVADGAQGDRVVFHYPRLQAAAGVVEKSDTLVPGTLGLERMRLAGTFQALPVQDAIDGENVVCFRSYLPGPMRAI